MKKLRKTPSRIKYEQSHPTVSARLQLETKKKVLAALKTLGMSVGDAFKVLAGELEIKAIPIEEARKAGFEEAKNLYMVTFPCHGCSKPVPITSQSAKQAAGKYMTEHGWSHPECLKKQNPQK